MFFICNPLTPIRGKNKMIKKGLILLALATSFGFGFLYHSVLTQKQTNTKKVTGIGGIFFKCKDPKKMNAWYKTHLGIDTNGYGATFEWREASEISRKGATQWSLFSEKSNYFDPSVKEFMINYRVTDLEALIIELKKENITIVDTMQTYDYGKFVHIMDMEGNKIELWEPID